MDDFAFGWLFHNGYNLGRIFKTRKFISLIYDDNTPCAVVIRNVLDLLIHELVGCISRGGALY